MYNNCYFISGILGVLLSILVKDIECKEPDTANVFFEFQGSFQAVASDGDTVVLNVSFDKVKPSAQTPSVNSFLLDDFSQGLREVNPGHPIPNQRYLFNMLPNTQSNGQGYSAGTQSASFGELIVQVDTGDVYMQFFPSPGGQWEYAREWGIDPDTMWAFNTYNRFSFEVMIPDGYQQMGPNPVNIKVGTYECDSCSGQGTHWYHHFNVPATGNWAYFQVDLTPDSRVGQSGYIEWGPQDDYFDGWKRFYFDGQSLAPGFYPATWRFRDFRFWEQTETEDEVNVYSLVASRVNQDSVFVGIRTHKDSAGVSFVVSYNGIETGTMTRTGTGGWNGVSGVFYVPEISPIIKVRKTNMAIGKTIWLKEQS